MIVTVSGRSGLRNAYVSVLSAEGSSAIRGASRWLDASAAAGLPTRVASAVNRAVDAALAELYDRFGRVAYGLALRVLRDEKLAEDAVQDAFLAAWRNADRFLPERAKASTWVLTFVHRRAVDLVRREDRRRAEPLGAGVEPAPAGSAEEDAWLRFERERVQAALSQLPDQQREALELAYYGGFSPSEPPERPRQTNRPPKTKEF